jgi:nucleotide-binding universal stress UspA family protein
MLRVRRLLFPTDLSESARHAYGHAIRLAAAFDAELHILHADLDEQDVVDRVKEGELTPAEPPADIVVRRAVVRGDSAARVILSYVEEQDVDLVVMGTAGRSGLGRLLLGSVAERIVREAPCPVMTVPLRSPAETVDRVLAPVDFSDHSRASLSYAKELAALHDAPLDVIHVVQEAAWPAVYGPEVAPLLAPQMLERSYEAIGPFVAETPGPEVETSVHVAAGYVASEVLRFCEERSADLIVLGTHGLTGIEHFLIGSVTEKILRRASCPVFVVKSFGKSLIEST